MTGVGALRALEPRPTIFVAATGAGAGMQSALWSVPGASAFLAGATFPYAPHEMQRFLGFRPAQFCSEETALDLAIAAYLRAREAANAEAAGASVALGVGLTASVASLQPHRGEHRVFVATLSARGAAVWSARLPKGAGEQQRANDGRFADELGVHALLDAAGIAGGARPSSANAEISRREVGDEEIRDRVLARPAFAPGGRRATMSAEEARLSALLPGSFDPFHAGHRMMAEAVEQQFHRRVIYTVTADPVHKRPLRAVELLDRVASIGAQPGARTVAITCSDPLFIDKARQFPGAGIVLGIDALIRMLDPSWGPAIAEMLEDFRSLGTHFYVVGRVVGQQWMTLDDVSVPPAGRDLFEAVDGRLDVSSTALRGEQFRSPRPSAGEG